MKHVFPFYFRLACILIILFVSGYLAVIGKDIFSPLLFAFIFALLLLPLSNFLENKFKFPKGLAGGVSIIVFLLVASVVIYSLSTQIANLTRDWPLLKTQLLKAFHDVQTWIEQTFNVTIVEQTEYIDKTTSRVISSGGSIIGNTVVGVSTFLLLLIFTMIYTFFILLFRKRLMIFIISVFPEKHSAVIYDIASHIKSIIRKYITGLFFQMVILVTLSCLVFWLIGIKYVFLIGLLVAVLNLIPYIGIYTALGIGFFITFATSGAQEALYLIIAGIIIHTIDSNFIMPKIVGSQVKVNPLVIILGVVVGGLSWGVPGMFLSVPLLAMAKIIFDRLEGFKTWGILLGDDEPQRRKIRIPLAKRKA